jgi:hypothetical protein
MAERLLIPSLKGVVSHGPLHSDKRGETPSAPITDPITIVDAPLKWQRVAQIGGGDAP